MSERHIGLVGAGLMGTGLARLFTNAGWTVRVFDPDAAALDRLAKGVPASADTLIVSQDMRSAAIGAALVIESAPEKPLLKQSIFVELAAMTGPETILATNSSVIPVSVVAEKVDDISAVRIVGTHFWNPADLIPLVEVIQGSRSGLAAIEITLGLLRAVGKDAVHVRRDSVPGNRLQAALWREAIALVDEGICTPEEVDIIVKRSFGLRLPVLGPLENIDLIGLKLTADILTVVLPTLSGVTKPPAGLQSRIARGNTGAKAGAGYYSGWNEKNLNTLHVHLAEHLRSLLRVK